VEGTWLVFRVEVQMGAEMREKIVFILRNPLLTLDQRVEQLLSLLIEEIKKELLTDEETRRTIGRDRKLKTPQDFKVVFEDICQAQLQKILKKMEEK